MKKTKKDLELERIRKEGTEAWERLKNIFEKEE